MEIKFFDQERVVAAGGEYGTSWVVTIHEGSGAVWVRLPSGSGTTALGSIEARGFAAALACAAREGEKIAVRRRVKP